MGVIGSLPDANGKRRTTITRALILNERGQTEMEIQIPGWVQQWVGCDLDGDGQRELFAVGMERNAPGDTILAANWQAWAISIPRARTLWEPTLPGAARLLEILPSATNHPATIALATRTDVYGLAGDTGQLRWHCPGEFWYEAADEARAAFMPEDFLPPALLCVKAATPCVVFRLTERPHARVGTLCRPVLLRSQTKTNQVAAAGTLAQPSRTVFFKR